VRQAWTLQVWDGAHADAFAALAATTFREAYAALHAPEDIDAYCARHHDVVGAAALLDDAANHCVVAGDDAGAKLIVREFVRSLGFTPVDLGSLRAAREIEDLPVSRFREWKAPLWISLIIFVLIYLVGFAK